MYVDVDEADVTILNQNLNKSIELFENISKSLHIMSNKSKTASNTIKPVLKDVNELIESKKGVESLINTLKEVSEAAGKVTSFEHILNDNIESIGLIKYMNSLNSAKQLYKSIQSKSGNFKGVVGNFNNLINNSETKVQNYLQSLVNSDPNTLINKKPDIKYIFEYFTKDNNDEQIKKQYITARSQFMIKKLSILTGDCLKTTAPFEKGQHSINKYTDLFLDSTSQEFAVIKQCQIPNILPIIIENVLINYIGSIISKYQFSEDSYLLILEITDNLIKLQYILKNKYSLSNNRFNLAIEEFINDHRNIFITFVHQTDSKFNIGKLNEQISQQLITDILNKLRKFSEFKIPLIQLISKFHPGQWLIQQNPPVKFVNVYSSVIPKNDEIKPDYLLSSFYSDMIDCIMINIEIGLKNTELKKTIQGFILIKDMFMVETIINRSQDLFQSLGSIGQERMTKLKNRFLKIFLDDFSHSSYIIIRDMTSIATSQASSTSGNATNLTSKEKENVKELFQNFNKSFEEALSNYQKLSFGDQILKNYLINEIKKMIVPSYNKLYDKYGNSDFTKNKSKYVKWDKYQFEQLLNSSL
ncbi:unnamed protein product [Candida verbasci]|uniref:Exocyst complex subunit Exo70 C-terminal domain-containing protein n=1 Tax=Candida verbasci TaxID=1227364 RepID=A0A9W4U1D6_9ASCO|nr:unnamed protein product [Candida verbasci]